MSRTIRKPYGPHDPSKYATINDLPSLTEQALNHNNALSTPNVVKRYLQTGDAALLNAKIPSPLFEVPDITYQQALQNMIDGREAFMSLPAAVRKEFDHSPEAFLDAINKDPQVLYSLGLAKAPDKPQEAIQPKEEVSSE